ncbi:MAG: LysM peptidoglycan-binding domain-containing protein [Elusimicrobia bacterium]|nr:LysM peptidoglycan-binding domain-containing protein [Elusimicrobiota bacterium]
MGNAFTALADDVHTIYYNPAGLGRITRTEVTSGYGRLYWGLDDDSNLGSGFFGYTQPVGKLGTFGLGYLNFSLVGHYAENEFLLSYGKNIWKPVCLGLNLKVLQQVVGQDIYTEIDPAFDYGGRDSKTSYSVDFGSLFSIGSRLYLALSITDMNQPDMIFHKTEQVQSSKIPYGFKAGFAYREDLLNVAVDVACKESVTQSESDIKIHTGAERWFFSNTFALRGGLGLGKREYKNTTMGASYKTGIFRFDYAFIYPLSGIEETYGSHRISLTLLFGRSEEEPWRQVRRNELEKRLNKIVLQLEKSRQETELTKQELEKTRLEVKQAQDRIENIEALKQKERQVEEAEDAHETAVKKEKERKYDYWYLMGEQYVEYGDWKGALNAYKNALEYKPGDRKVMNEIEYIQKEIQKPAKKAQPEKEKPRKLEYYIVQKGNTLLSIAEKVYGDSSRWKEIYEANRDKITEGKPKPGQVLIIP